MGPIRGLAVILNFRYSRRNKWLVIACLSLDRRTRYDASQNTIRQGLPKASDGVRQRSNLTSLSSLISLNIRIHFSLEADGTSSSHFRRSCHSSCKAIFDLITMAAATPIGSKMAFALSTLMERQDFGWSSRLQT